LTYTPTPDSSNKASFVSKAVPPGGPPKAASDNSVDALNEPGSLMQILYISTSLTVLIEPMIEVSAPDPVSSCAFEGRSPAPPPCSVAAGFGAPMRERNTHTNTNKKRDLNTD